MRYMTVSIRDYLDDENLLYGIFDTFFCPKNKDIEDFLKENQLILRRNTLVERT